jgi:hypothetical protein
MAALPTGTVTFLFTDIEGSTTLLQRLGDRRLRGDPRKTPRLLRTAFEEGQGREVDTQGMPSWWPSLGQRCRERGSPHYHESSAGPIPLATKCPFGLICCDINGD